MTEESALDLSQYAADEAALAAARAEKSRMAAVTVVQAVYRLAKASLLHAVHNDAVTQLVRYAQSAVQEYCQSSNAPSASILFASDTVFVNGQMLRASRQAYQASTELAAMLAKGGVSEVTLPSSVSTDDIVALTLAIAETTRSQSAPGGLLAAPCGSIKLRRVDAQTSDGDEGDQSTRTRSLRTYAASVVVMREFLAQLRAGNSRLPQRLKRVAQRLIAHAEEDPRTLVALVGAQVADPDPASALVNSAILSVAMALQLTHDRSLLTALAMSALLQDVGKVRLERDLAGAALLGIERTLDDDELDLTPQSNVVMLTSLGRIHEPSITRVVLGYEAAWLLRSDRIGMPYGGKRPPTVLARCLATARAFIDLITPVPGEPTMTIDDAIQQLGARAKDANDRTDIKLLLGALGFFPPGTLVELNTGETAVVLETPALPVDYARPPVSILYDAEMRLLETPRDLDLAAPPGPGQPPRCIRKTVDADEQQLKQMRAFVMAKVSGVKQRRAARLEAQRAAKPAVPQRKAVPQAPPEPSPPKADLFGELDQPASARPAPSRGPARSPEPPPSQRSAPPSRRSGPPPSRGLAPLSSGPPSSSRRQPSAPPEPVVSSRPRQALPPAPQSAPPQEDPSLIRSALVFPGQASEPAPSSRRFVAATEVPSSRRRDPRADSEPPILEPAESTPASGDQPASAPRQGRTREVSWDDYGQFVQSTSAKQAVVEQAKPSPPAGGLNDLLAAYLSGEEQEAPEPAQLPEVEPVSEPPRSSQRAAEQKTRAVRWSAADAMLRDLEAGQGSDDSDSDEGGPTSRRPRR